MRDFEVGDLVQLANPGPGGDGVYRVARVNKDGTYALQGTGGGRILASDVFGAGLMPARCPNMPELPQREDDE